MEAVTVQVINVNDEWIVVFDDNGERHERAFAIEEHARSFAAGQSVRLSAQAKKQADSENE